jgi:hypothetical protein
MPALPSQHYTTPSRVWLIGLPEKTLFGKDTNLSPGTFTAPVKLAGAGTGVVYVEGNPHDTYSDLRIKCLAAGSINQRGIVNPGALPVFQISSDGGVTWGNAETVSLDEDTAFIDDLSRGVRWKFTGATPVFSVGDIWQTSAQPSPNITALIGVCSSGSNQKLLGSFKLPLVTWPESLETVIAYYVRWALIVKRGLSADQNMQQYKPSVAELPGGGTAQGWLDAAQRGDFQDDPDFTGAGSSFVEADIMLPQQREADFGTRMWYP